MFKYENTYYHIRYIKYRGIFGTLIRIFLIFIFSKITNTKILWTCHNIFEHNIPNKNFNSYILKIISGISHKIIVFHYNLLDYLPHKHHNKTIVANFGDFRNFYDDFEESNNEFLDLYNNWKVNQNIKNIDLIYISSARKSALEKLISALNKTDLNAVIIAPKINLSVTISKNIFYYNKYVYKEIVQIFKSNRKIVGFIGHSNVSVPTSLYMFASFDIPILGYNFKPINTIINDFKIGKIVNDEDIQLEVNEIQKNMNFYKSNLKSFIKSNSWDKSAEKHLDIF